MATSVPGDQGGLLGRGDIWSQILNEELREPLRRMLRKGTRVLEKEDLSVPQSHEEASTSSV